MEIFKKYKGETWEWGNAEKAYVNCTNCEQGIMDVYMKWINSWLMQSALDYCSFRELDKEEQKHILIYFNEHIRNYINLLKGVGFYPKEYFDKECPEMNFVYERELTAYELYRVVYNLDLLEKRYQMVLFGSWDVCLDTCDEKTKKRILKDLEYKERLYNNPEMFKYH